MLKTGPLVRFIKVMTSVGCGEILAADGDVDPTCARRGKLPVWSRYPLHDTSQSCPLSLLLTFDDITDNRMRIRRSSRQRSCFRHSVFSQTNIIICHKTALAELPRFGNQSDNYSAHCGVQELLVPIVQEFEDSWCGGRTFLLRTEYNYTTRQSSTQRYEVILPILHAALRATEQRVFCFHLYWHPEVPCPF